jgi:hypothetical protein
MKMVLSCILAISMLQTVYAQQYNITTNKADPFSIALIKLLNAASNRFADYKSDLIRSTWLGDDHKLAFEFPGSSMAVIRSRDWDKNAYVEFRGFGSIKDISNGMQTLIAKISNALGDQLMTPVVHGDPTTLVQIAGLSIKDKNGYFTSHFELFPGSSSAVPYLTGPEKEEDNDQPKKYFILLKIQGGIPSYQYYIPSNIVSPDQQLTQTLQYLLKAATNDFDSLPEKRNHAIAIKKKKTDTLQLNGYTVLLNRRGQNHIASILFPAPADSVAFNERWNWCHLIVQSAVGSGYVYHRSESTDSRYIVYYAKLYDQKNPQMQLELKPGIYNTPNTMDVVVRSSQSHSVKRGLSRDDFD